MVATEPHATLRYATVSCRARRGWLAREAGPPAPPEPRLLDRVRAALRARHGSRRTEEVYVAWIRRYVLFHGKRHPTAMGAPEVTRFYTSLAVEGHVAASTQNQALSALLFLYREVLGVGLPWLEYKALLGIDGGIDLGTVEYQKRFHGGMPDALIAIDERVVLNQRHTQHR